MGPQLPLHRPIRRMAPLVGMCCLIVGLVLLAATPSFLMSPGISTPASFNAYLGSAFPTQLTDSWQWTTIYTGTGLNNIITARRVPGTNIMAFGHIDGRIFTFDFDQANPAAVLIGDIAPTSTYPNNRYGLKGIAFHPEYGQIGSPNREYIYVAYLSNNTTRRLSRYTIPATTGVLDVNSELVMIEQIVPGGSYHSYGEIAFGKDGFLYLPTGDAHGGGFGPYAGTPISDTIMNVVQRIDHNLSGGILRIDVDMDPTKSHPPRKKLPQAFPSETSGVGYYIPNDNPWLAADSSIMEEYYSLGHRNPWKMSLDTVTGTFWSTEVGPHGAEELNRIEKGHNYGWPYKAGHDPTIPWDRTPPTAPEPSPYTGILTDPVFSPARADSRSLLLGGIYRGTKWPELYGKAFVSDVSTRKFWMVGYDELSGTTTSTSFPTMTGATWTVFESPHGDILQLRTNGTINRLEKSTNNSASLPAQLSLTGAFTDLVNMTPASGFIPYTVNTALWSDRAAKSRWIAIPNDGSYNTAAEQVTFSADNPWTFPSGTVIVKHFELPLDDHNPTVTTKIETRFIIVGNGGDVYGVTYKWRADQSDADLLPAGDTRNLTITEVGGATHTQIWHFPDRGECLSCHNPNSGQILGLNTRQQNRDYTYPSSVTDNQLHTWNYLNIFDQDIGDPGQYRHNVPLDDPKAIRAYKVRSYLDANCSYCHQPGGVNAAFDARLTTDLEAQGLINTPTLSAASHSSTVVKPGDPLHSELWLRDNSVAADAMPPLAKTLKHDAYMDILTEWIEDMTPAVTDTLGEASSMSIDNNWTNVSFSKVYNNPVIVFGAPSYVGAEPVTVRVQNLTTTGCQVRLQEWACQDQTHGLEAVPYLVIEAGRHTLPNGKVVMAGHTQADQNFQQVTFSQAFGTVPIVLTQVTTTLESDAVVTRQNHNASNVTGFQVKVQEVNNTAHVQEQIDWVAIEAGTFDGYLPFEAARMPQVVEENWVMTGLSQDYEHAPLFIGQITSHYGGDLCWLRFMDTEGDSVRLFLQEETCGDPETDHYLENVDYVSVAGDGMLLGTIHALDGGFPVEWLSFEVKKVALTSELQWSTGSEQQSSHFEIERSTAGVVFEMIGQVAATGNSSITTNYRFTDLGMQDYQAPWVYYRLKQVDLDGAVDYSPILKLAWTIDGATELAFRVFPVPARDQITFERTLTTVDPQLETHLLIYSLQGEVVAKHAFTEHTLSLATENWASGSYLAILEQGGKRLIRKILILK